MSKILSGTELKTLELKGSTSGQITQQASATTTNYTLTWPATAPASNGYSLTATTAGVASWTSVGGGSGGSTVVTANDTLADGDPELVNINTSNGVDITLPAAPTLGTSYKITSAYRKLNLDINAKIHSIVFDSDDMYLAGEFTEVNGTAYNRILKYNVGSETFTDIASANGIIRKLLIEGLYLYAGGDFTSVNSNTTEGIVRIELATPANKVYNTTINTTSIYDMVSDGTYLYLAGDFISNNSPVVTTTANITAMSPSDDNPSVIFPTFTMTGGCETTSTDSTYMYVAGDCTVINGTSVNYVARVNKSTGALDTSWVPVGITGTAIYHIIADDTNNFLYCAGNFSITDGSTTSHLCRLKTNVTSNYLDTTWLPAPNAQCLRKVMALDSANSKLYIGGTFTVIGENTASRNRIARIDTTTGDADSWNPNANNQVAGVYLDSTNNLLYVGGTFTTIGGASRTRGAALDTTVDAGTANSFDPNLGSINGSINFYVTSTHVYIGGLVPSINGNTSFPGGRTDLDGVLDTGWSTFGGSWPWVFELAGDPVDSTKIYAVGAFQSFGGDTVSGFAHINISGPNDGKINSNFNPTITGSVVKCSGISVEGDTVYLVGDTMTSVSLPSNVGNVDRFNLDLTDTNIWTSNPNVNNTVHSIIHDGSTNLYIGGEFTEIDTTTRNYIAKLTDSTGALNGTWNPNANGIVRTMELSTDVYVGGDFTSIGGQSRNYIAKLSTGTTGPADASWDPNVNAAVYSLAVDSTNSHCYLGGNFTTVSASNLIRNYLARVSTATTGALTDWAPNCDGIVRVITDANSNDDYVYVGGEFKRVNNKGYKYLTQIFKDTNIITQNSELVSKLNRKLASIPYYIPSDVLQITYLSTNNWILEEI
jgi:hypothetical protein